jgi:DNA-binding transcriptional LysR family regulator
VAARRRDTGLRLRIASSVSFGRTFVAAVVNEFLAEHPEMNIELLLDRAVDLAEEGMGVAVRVVKVPDSTMVAHSIGEVQRVIVASPALIKRSGLPKIPTELRDKRCVRFTGVVSPGHWTFVEGRKQIQIPVTNALVTNQVDVGVKACVQGAGFGRLLSYHVLEEINAARLTRILKKFDGESIPVSIQYPSARHPSPNVRAFVAFAQPLLRERLQRLQKPGRIALSKQQH